MRVSTFVGVVTVVGLLAPGALSAQAPVGGGTAAAMGLGGMTEARFPVATMWNPALLGIFDGPTRSYEILTGSASSARPGGLFDYYSSSRNLASDKSSVVQGNILSGLNSFYKDGAVRKLGGQADVELLGLHDETFGVSLTTHALSREVLPDRAVRIMMGDPTAISSQTTVADSVLALSTNGRHWAGTTLALSRAYDAGIEPIWGHVWAGASITGTLLHTTSLSRAIYTDASTSFIPGVTSDPSAPAAFGSAGVDYMNVSVHNTQVYGTSIGLVANPAGPVLLSATLVNPFQYIRGPKNVADVTWLDTRYSGLDASGHTRVYARNTVVDSTAPAWVQADAKSLLQNAEFSSLIRVGMSVDETWGRILTGYAIPVRSRNALDANTGERWTVGFVQPSSALHLRGSVSGLLDGGKRIMAGFEVGYCGSRMAVGAGTERHPGEPSAVVLSLGWSHGDGPCGSYR